MDEMQGAEVDQNCSFVCGLPDQRKDHSLENSMLFGIKHIRNLRVWDIKFTFAYNGMADYG